MKTFLHVIPARDMANTYHGTYKDVVTRAHWLKQRFPGYRQIRVESDDPAALDPYVAEALAGALIEYTYFPRILRRLKQMAPDTPLAVRCINLEPLQHLDNHGWWPQRGPLWMLYGMARLGWMDLQAKRYADQLLCINNWEIQRYWRWLPGKARCRWLPYICPEHLIPRQSMPYAQRRIIACLPTSRKNRKSWDLVTRFQQFATAMKRAGCQDEFVITGNLRDWNLPTCPDAEPIGFVEDLAAFAGTCKAVALLSPLGYGFKTTLGDALAAGAHVLAHPALIQRCPDVVKPYLIAVDTEDLSTVADPMSELEIEPCGMAIHQELARIAEGVMQSSFGEALP